MAAMIPLMIQGVGMLQQANAQKSAAAAQQVEKDYEANQLDRQANETQATAQRAAEEENRKSMLLQSRAQAIAAASGGNTLDPSVVNIISGINRQGDLNARSRLYGGATAAAGLQDKASLARFEGDQLINAGQSAQSATILNGVSSMYGNYERNRILAKSKTEGYG